MQVATFIIQRILADEDGLAYICAAADRFFAVRQVLDMILKNLEKQPSPRLLKLVISCYSRLSDNHRLIEKKHYLKHLDGICLFHSFKFSYKNYFILKQGWHYTSKLSSKYAHK